jgi:hypothetical protein
LARWRKSLLARSRALVVRLAGWLVVRTWR